MHPRSSWMLRVAAAAAVGVAAAGAFAVQQAGATDATAASFVPGQGYASGHAMDLTTVYSSARLGFNVADASAQYQDGTGEASGAAIDSGFVTLLAELQTCGEPGVPPSLVPPTTSVSTDDNGNTKAEAGTNHGASTAPLGAVSVSARPNASGQTDIASGGASLPGLVGLSAATVHTEASSTTSTMTRSSFADVRDGAVSLLGGLVQLRGLHWQARLDVTGSDSRADQRRAAPLFELGSVSVAGITVPFPSGSSYASSLTTLNKLAAPLGIQFRLPAIERSTTGGSTTVSVGPMTVAFGGKTVLGPLASALLGGATLPQIENALKPGVFDPRTCSELAGILKVSKPLNAAWNSLGSGYPIILGAAVASIDGGGELDLDLGGATATLDDTYYPPANFGAPALITSGGNAPGLAAAPAAPAVPGLSQPPAEEAPATDLIRTVVRRTFACRTTSLAGRPMCWRGHAVVGGIGAAMLTAGLFSADEAVRRRRMARRNVEGQPIAEARA